MTNWVYSIRFISKPSLVKMVDLREKLHAINGRYWNIRINEKHFRGKRRLNNKKLSFCSSQVAREMVTLSLQLDNRDTAPPKVKEIQQIGLDIRVAVLSNNTEMSWPPKPCELCENAVNLPPELDVFALLSPNWTHKSQRNILIVASGVTWGRQKPPKQILLPYAVTTL